MPQDGEIVLETEKITKEFPGVRANDEVSIVLKRGEILSLLGENGAGKSTLVNILYGLYTPTFGTVRLRGREVHFHSPREAIQEGLGMVHQHFMLVETLTVTENIILGSEPGRFNTIDYAAARRQVQEISERYHLKVDPDARIETLSVGQQQRVEILKALYREAEILILDEPTAVLTPQEVEELFRVVERLRDSGVSIILITHKLEEVKAVSERVYVLRQGKVAGEQQVADVSTEELAKLMVGREVVLSVEKEPKEIGEGPIFVVESVTILGEKGLPAIDGLSLEVRPGELVGIAGVDGNGQGELAEGIMGLRIPTSGRILYQDRDITRLSTKERIHRRISFVPADRQRFGLIRSMTVAENIIIGYHDREPASSLLRLNQSYIADYAGKLVEEYDIRTPTVTTPVAHLSGGNQQKLILAREFAREPRFALLNQPTRGVDVGAIEYIREQILKMRDQNVAVLLISLELEEIFALADRILVLYEGKIVAEFRPEETSREEVGYYMTGGTERSSA